MKPSVSLRGYVDRRLADHKQVHDVLAEQVRRADDGARSANVRLAAVERVTYLGIGMAIILAFVIPLALRFVRP